MTGLRQALAGYLELRRAWGSSWSATRNCSASSSLAGRPGAATVTTADALAWATLPGASPGWLLPAAGGARLRRLPGHPRPRDRGSAARVTAGRAPPRHALPVFRADVAALLAAGRAQTPLRQATIKTLIGLLAVTGMRGGEAFGARR